MIAQRIRLAGVDYWITEPGGRAPANARLLSPAKLRALLATHGASPRIRALLAELEGRGLERVRHSGAQLRGHERPPAWLLAKLRCYELAPVIPRVSGPIELPTVALGPSGFEPNEMFDEQPHWIEFSLIDEDDEAIAGVLCEITLPSGKVVRRTTDRFGLVRIEGIASAGECSFGFPTLDQSAWERA